MCLRDWFAGRGAGLFLLALATSIALGVCGCSAKKITRTLVPAESFATLDHASPFLKVHFRDGRAGVLSAWSVDDSSRIVRGQGRMLDTNRRPLAEGELAIPLDSVALFETNLVKPSPSITGLAVITGVSLAITAYCIANPKACFGSCPTFYVGDGVKPVLQAEGFSASIAPALEATDVDALWRAQPEGSTLTVEMANEALETHVVRSVRVLAAPRPAGARVVRTSEGTYRVATSPRAPLEARAAEGDCRAALSALDGDERHSAPDSTNLAAREEIDLDFGALPDGDVGIVFATRQTLLSTYLVYQALAYLGTRAGQWLASLSSASPAEGERVKGLARELGKIDVQVEQSPGAWHTVGEAGETGPLATEVMCVPVPHPPDGSGRYRLHLTRGLWRIDQVALHRLGARVTPRVLLPYRVSTAGRIDPAGLAALLDSSRTLVTGPGDRYAIQYRLPGRPRAYEYFLESRGYYMEWMRQEWLAEENPIAALGMVLDPGGTLRRLAPAYARAEPSAEQAFWNSRYAKP
jgi:hypothetical protein